MRRFSLILVVLCGHAAAQQPPPVDAISVGIVFDSSGSMIRKLPSAKRVVVEFVKSVNPCDEFLLLQFNDRPVLMTAFTSVPDDVEKQLALIEPRGRTALFDAIEAALREVQKAANPRRALLLITEGGDNAGKSTLRRVRTLVQRAGVPVFAVGIYGPLHLEWKWDTETLSDRLELVEIARASGARHYAIRRSVEMPKVVAQFLMALRSQRR
jgi:Ca-activated chloride channel family protein